jgi:hypothetical protein
VALPGGSSLGAAPLSQVMPTFFNEPIETAGVNISDKLPVPFLGVKLGKPGPKRGSLFVGETPDGLFDLLNRTHISATPTGRRTHSHQEVFASMTLSFES